MPLRCPLFLNDRIADGPLSVRRCDQAIAIMVVSWTGWLLSEQEQYPYRHHVRRYDYIVPQTRSLSVNPSANPSVSDTLQNPTRERSVASIRHQHDVD